MKKNIYINPHLKNVTLHNVKLHTKNAHKRKQQVCHESALSGHFIWSELHTPTVIRDIFENMTEAEFQQWLGRLYGEKQIPA